MVRGSYMALAAAVLLGSGCLPEGPAPDAFEVSTAPVSSPYGLVRIRAMHPRTGASDALSMSVDAHFVQRAGVSRESVMQALDLWEPGAVEEGCVVVPSSAAADASARVSLLDAGALRVAGNGEAATLPPRTLPSYVPQVAGVVYGTARPVRPSWAAGEAYVVQAEGGAGFGAFSVRVEAPAPVEIVAVNGRAPGSATALDIEGGALEIDLSADASVVWLTLHSATESMASTVECRLTDAASVRFDGAELDGALGTGSLDLTVRSVQTAALAEASGAEGQVVFEFVDRLELRR